MLSILKLLLDESSFEILLVFENPGVATTCVMGLNIRLCLLFLILNGVSALKLTIGKKRHLKTELS